MNLTAIDICNIIKTCRESSVSSFRIEGEKLEVCFDKPISEAPTPSLTPNKAVEEKTEHFDDLPDFERSTVREDEKTEIEELVISDPAKYEEMLARGELVDEKTYD
jgi:hypothetical protein